MKSNKLGEGGKERKIIKDDGASSSSPGNEWKRKEEEKFVSRKRRIIGSGRSREEKQDEEVRPKYQEKRERIVNVSIQVSDVFSEERRRKRKKRDGELEGKESDFEILFPAPSYLQ